MSEPAGAHVVLRDVRRRFRSGTLALDGASLEVRPGEFVSLLGPSGCGKTTLLRLVAGLLEPDAGHVDRGFARGEAGFVFQEPTLMPWASVRDNVALPLRVSGTDRRRRREAVDDAIERVGLGGFGAARPRELSGGMRMRVSLARALVTRPRLLLLDEPFAALDEITRFRLNDDLLALWEERRFTVLFVTHSVFESAYLASRVAVMTPRPGRVASDLEVPLPYPRRASLRTAPEYAAHCRELSDRLHAAMGVPE